jgi:hypothetical protein
MTASYSRSKSPVHIAVPGNLLGASYRAQPREALSPARGALNFGGGGTDREANEGAGEKQRSSAESEAVESVFPDFVGGAN